VRDRSCGTPHGRLYACVHGGDVRAWLVMEEYRACVTDHSERHTVDCNACVHGGGVRAWLVTEEYRVGVSGEWFFTCLSFSHPQRQSADETQRQSVVHRSATYHVSGYA